MQIALENKPELKIKLEYSVKTSKKVNNITGLFGFSVL